ncbi:glycoside hydrolase family 10 protein, partial [candidate division KSB1 bacterium]
MLTANVYSQTGKFHAFWATRFSLTSEESIDRLIDFAVKGGFNNIFVQVRGRGDAFYNSEIVPKAEELEKLNNKGFDPLKIAIEKAHEKNIKVHAWINTLFTWSKPALPQNQNHIVNRHPDWFMQNHQGNLSVDFLQENNVGGLYLNPYLVEVKNYIEKVILEIIKNYNVDGIHLDYIRYPSDEFGYSLEIRNEFKQKTGVDPVSLNGAAGSNSRKSKIKNEWINFRGNILTEFVSYILKKCREVKPKIKYSCSVKPEIQEAKNHFLQFWDEWLNKDIIDFAVVMNYTEVDSKFKKRLENILKSVLGHKLVIGISSYNQSIPSVNRKIKILNNYIIKGICIFSFDDIKQKNQENLYLK